MFAGMAAMDGKLYVTGGRDGGNNRSKAGEVLDLATMRWESLPEMTTPRFTTYQNMVHQM